MATSAAAVGVKSLRRIQLGLESTPGTAVAATTFWRGPGVGIEDGRELTFVEEDIGTIAGVDRTFIAKEVATIAFEETPATFEQLPYIFEAGVEHQSPSQDGSGSGYIYTYSMVTTAQKSIKTYTIEAGDNQQAEEMQYSFVTEFALTGEAGGPLNMSATWQGQQVTNTTFTGSLSLPTVEDILFSKGTLYIDANTIGTTAVTDTLLAAELSVTTGNTAVFTADNNNLYFSFVKQVNPEVSLSITYEHNSTAVTEKTAWRDETRRLIRLKWEGSTLTTAGTSYSVKTLIVDVKGKYESFDVLGEQDGNDVYTATLIGKADSFTGSYLDLTVVNELSSLT